MARSRRKQGGGNRSCIKKRDAKGRVLKDGLGRPLFFSSFDKVTSNPIKIAARQRALALKAKQEAERRAAAAEETLRMHVEGHF